jgi:hypothetical protein
MTDDNILVVVRKNTLEREEPPLLFTRLRRRHSSLSVS